VCVCLSVGHVRGIAEFAGLENDGLENEGVEQEQTYAFKVIRVFAFQRISI